MGSPTGIIAIYKTTATMLIESSALFAVSLLLAIVPWAVGNPIMNVFAPVLSVTQVHVFP